MSTPIITTEQKVNLIVTPVTSAGNAASIVGSPLWSSSDLSIASLVIAADGMSCYAVAAGVGSATITVAANAGSASVPLQIENSIVVAVTSAPAAALNITASAPVNQ